MSLPGGKITVNAVGDAIKAKDYIAVADGNINLTAGTHGINASNKTDTTMGFVYIEGGNFNITSVARSSESTKHIMNVLADSVTEETSAEVKDLKCRTDLRISIRKILNT